MSIGRKIARTLLLWVVNHVFVGTHCFGVKRSLLRMAGVPVGADTNVVGPLHLATTAHLSIGERSWIGKNMTVDGGGTVAIGSNVDIAPQVTFATGGHRIGTHERRAGEGQSMVQSVEDGCWIGAGALIVGNTCVGAGSVVAAGAVVTKNVVADVLVAGVPAVVKRELSQTE